MDGEKNIASGGMGGGAMKDVRAKFAVDTSQMEKLVKGFSTIKKDIEWMHKNLDDTIKKVNRLSSALGKVNMAQASATEVATPSNSSSSAINAAIQKSQQQVSPSIPVSQMGIGGGGAGAGTTGGGMFKNFRGATLSGGAGGGSASAARAIAGGVANLVGAGVGMIDQRADAGYGPALSADRMGVLYQQMYGVTNRQYANQFRKPLQGAMLGAGGINTLLGLQAQTGLQAKTMMPGVEALRVASGFSLSTQDLSSMIRTLASPMVNNRLTMTAGTGIYGPGGSQRNPMQVVQQITRSAGLTNETMVNSGMQQGSVTRARLTSMGVPEDMQDMVLQYAKENVQYQKRSGGKGGMYDPSSAAQRKLMGIDKNFATEKEMTDVRRAERDERFYNRQADNYAALERNTQRLIDVFAALEDRLSGLIGGRISTRNNPTGLAAAGIMGAVGSGLMMTGNPFAMGAGAVALVGSKLIGGGRSGGPAGDGTATPTAKKSGSGNIKVPIGYAGKMAPLEDLEKNATFSKLNPKFKERLIKMMMENPKVGIGQGYRSPGDQRNLFFQRYTRTKEDTGTFWKGTFWKKNANVPDAAPPGMSMHEIGLAADLVGDLDWVQKNASRFGLKTFANVNEEPWHVQPSELPNGRSAYEKAGAPMGTISGGDKHDPTAMFNGVAGGGVIPDTLSNMGTASKSMQTYSQMSISDSIASAKEANRSLSSSGAVSAMSVGAGGGGPVEASSVSNISNVKGTAGYITRTRKGVPYRIPNRKFTRQDWEAIAWVETHKKWDFVNGSKLFRGGLAMHKGVWDTYGGKEFAPFANKATPEEQMAVAQRSSFDGYKDPKSGKFVPAAGIGGFESVAKNAIKWPNMKQGDGGPGMAPSRSAGSVRIDGGNNITIAPNIYIQSSGNNSADAHRAAKEVSRMIVEETKLAAMRSM